MIPRSILAIALLLAAATHPAAALPPDQAKQLYDRVSPSLVVVQYTLESEAGRRDLIGQGVVIGPEGRVMTSMALFPVQLPDEQMKEFKIIVPGDQEKEFPAEFLGRDERTDMAYLKPKEPQNWPAISFEESPVSVGDPVVSIGLLPKDAGYRAYLLEASVSSVLRGPVPFVLVSPGGLTTIGSPVFNSQGKAIGIVPYQSAQSPWLNRGGDVFKELSTPPRAFVPARDFLSGLKNAPDGKPLRIPWLGAVLTGMNKEVAEYYHLENVTAAQIGDVLPDTPASKAGLHSGDKIIKVDGHALERGDEPDESAAILGRQIRRMNVGQTITLTVLRDRDKPAIDITVTLDEQPRQANLARRFFADDLGLSVREIVFADTYARKLPSTTGGVVVAFVRQASSAATAGLHAGDLVTQLNKAPVTDLDSFKKNLDEFRQQNPKELIVLVVIRDQKTEVVKIEPPQ